MSTIEVPQQHTGIQIRKPGDMAISNENLTEYGKMLQFDSKYLHQANDAAKKVVDALRRSTTVPERFSVSESHTCQEGVDDTGIDVVAFVKADLDKSKVCEEYCNVAKQLSNQSNIRVNEKHLIHFDMNGVRVNLGVSHSKGKTVGEHRQAVFKHVTTTAPGGKMNQNIVEKISLDLHDSTSDFLQHKNQPGDKQFEMAAQRLARAWRRTALASWSWDSFSPLDSMLVMQNALINEKGQNNMKNVMKRFFNDMANLENMSVKFPENFTLYDQNMIPQWIQSERPLLLDPVNPWRNPLNKMEKKMMGDIKKVAHEALKVLETDSAKMKDLFKVDETMEKRGA